MCMLRYVKNSTVKCESMTIIVNSLMVIFWLLMVHFHLLMKFWVLNMYLYESVSVWHIVYQLQSTLIPTVLSLFFPVLLLHSSPLWIRGKISNMPMWARSHETCRYDIWVYSKCSIYHWSCREILDSHRISAVWLLLILSQHTNITSSMNRMLNTWSLCEMDIADVLFNLLKFVLEFAFCGDILRSTR